MSDTLKDSLFRAALRRETYQIGGGVSVEVREMTSREVTDLTAALKGLPDYEQGAAVVAAATEHGDGSKVFADAEEAMRLPPRHLRGIGDLATRLSSISAGGGGEEPAGEAAAGKPAPKAAGRRKRSR